MAKLNYASPLSHTNTSKILQRILNLIEVRRDLGNRASLVNRAYVKSSQFGVSLHDIILQKIKDCRPYWPLIPVLQATKRPQTLQELPFISRRLSNAI